MAFPLNDQIYTKSFTPREYQVRENFLNYLKDFKKIYCCTRYLK